MYEDQYGILKLVAQDLSEDAASNDPAPDNDQLKTVQKLSYGYFINLANELYGHLGIVRGEMEPSKMRMRPLKQLNVG